MEELGEMPQTAQSNINQLISKVNKYKIEASKFDVDENSQYRNLETMSVFQKKSMLKSLSLVVVKITVNL